MWDARSGECLAQLEGHTGDVTACAFSPDGARLLSAGRDGTLRLWDAHSHGGLARLEGHTGTINACAFSPDGTRLLSAGDDGTLRLWDAHSGECLCIHAMVGAPHPGHAVWEPATNRLIEAAGEAWRWLAWLRRGPDGSLQRLPLDQFGSLPAPQHLSPQT